MLRLVSALMVLVSGWAFGLTLSPMQHDELVFNSYVTANLVLENTEKDVQFYSVWASDEEGQIIFEDVVVVGGKHQRNIQIPIYGIQPDKLRVFRICVQQKPGGAGWKVVGRICAKVRYYWPLAPLRELQ